MRTLEAAVVVTGGNRVIGGSRVEAFAAAGAHTLATDLPEVNLLEPQGAVARRLLELSAPPPR